MGKLMSAVAAFAAALSLLGGAAVVECQSLDGLFSSMTIPTASEYEWDESVAPDYYLVVGTADEEVISYTDNLMSAGSVGYSSLDSLNRPTGVYARLTHCSVVSAKNRGRQEIDVDPVGYTDNAKTTIELANGKTYNGYFWNRSHLLADSLGGDPVTENLITGTRTQNVGDNDGDGGGMAYCETIARDWLWSHSSGSLDYAVVPVYVGSELVPRACLVDMRSSDGEIDMHVIVYNAAKGHTIDYATGEWS